MASTHRDQARRDSILRLTLEGLEADLDDLRDDLLDALESFEGELREQSESLPSWLAVDPAAIRELFQLPSDGEGPAGVLGPRTVALAAARVEAFIDRWLADPRDELDAEAVEEYEADHISVLDHLKRHETFARHTASDAHETLSDWLDGILSELDQTRESDESALRQLITEGTVDRGRDARAEIAELWEEQRERAAQVRKRWTFLEELTFRGLEESIAGLVELREMFVRADEGARGAYSELADVAEAPAPDASEEIDQAGGGTMAGLQHEDGDDAAVDEPRRVTEQLEIAGLDEPSNTFLRIPKEESSDAEIDEVGDTLIDDVGETAPIDIGELNQLTQDSAVESDEDVSEDAEPSAADSDAAEPAEPDAAVSEAGETDATESDATESDATESDATESAAADSDVAESAATESAAAESDADESDAVPTSKDAPADDEFEESNDDEPDQQDAAEASEIETLETDREPVHIDADEDTAEPDEAEAPDEPAPRRITGDLNREHVEQTVGDTFRFVERWVRVPIAEVILIPLVALAVLGAMIVMSIGAKSGEGPDPILDTPWGIPLFIGAAVWLILVPALRYWRFRWDGIVPRVVRYEDVVEEVELAVGRHGIKVGQVEHSWDGVRLRVARWESTDDGTFGWVIFLESPRGEEVFAAAERNFSEWERSKMPIEEIPDHVWQVDSRLLRAIKAGA